MLKLVFAGNLVYARESGFQTPEISIPFKALEDFSGSKENWCPRVDSNHRPAV